MKINCYNYMDLYLKPNAFFSYFILFLLNRNVDYTWPKTTEALSEYIPCIMYTVWSSYKRTAGRICRGMVRYHLRGHLLCSRAGVC